MLGAKLTFSKAYHPQTDGLGERMIQTLEDIIRIFCAYGMEYKDHEGYTHNWVTLRPEVQLAYNTSVHSVTGKTPAIFQKGWNPLLPVDYLKKNLLSVHKKARDFQRMWKTECDNAEKCIVEGKLYNKQRYNKSLRKMRHSFVGPFTIIRLVGKNAVEFRLTEEFSRKQPLFPVRLVKPYHQIDDRKFLNRKEIVTHEKLVE
ncbi:hypothetical protein O181_030097 [Austropuccinia psidii MF-1]|uniref:Integrase catalytic domain-containing protein n=1 Tax=Austropuccinia psidii MF-1 TaxID=1389203 RepID=A0A9Q3CXX3_9BASI|nr:hypothetical protein [Austropuccinia psidii MF-1]